MQRNCNVNRKAVVGKLAYSVGKTARGKRYVSLRYVYSVRARHERQKLSYVFVVVKRLSATHKHYVGNVSMPFFGFSEIGVYGKHFGKHFTGREIANHASDAGCAERTTHATPHLCGNAYRVSVALFHQRAFYHVSVGKKENIFNGFILGNQSVRDFYRLKIVRRSQFFPVRIGQIAHFGNRRVFRHPFIDLRGAKRLKTVFG